jgi:hypothetical protein
MLGRLEVGDEADSRGPVVREIRGRRPAWEGVISKGKRISREDATDAWARWAGWTLSACGGRRGQWASGAERPGWAARSAGPKSREKEFLN